MSRFNFSGCYSSVEICLIHIKLGRCAACNFSFGIRMLKDFSSSILKTESLRVEELIKITFWAVPNLPQEGMIVGKV